MKPFRTNTNGKLVFPSSIFIDLDFSVISDLDHLNAVVRRDFETKAPTGTELAEGAAGSAYPNRYELLRAMGLHLFWAHRFALTMYDKRPTRWRDVPKNRDDVFVPALQPWEDRAAKVAAVETAYRSLPPAWNERVEDELFVALFDVFSNKLHHATELPPIKETVAEVLAIPGAQTTVLGDFDPDYPRFSDTDIFDADEEVAELEALRRWSMVLHNQFPWDRASARLAPVAELHDEDVVVVFYPKNRDILDFITKVRTGQTTQRSTPVPAQAVEPIRPLAPIVLAGSTGIQPKIEALAVRKGEVICSNDDVVRNAPPSWSPMSAHDILAKTGIERRRYTEEPLENIALEAARAAMEHAGRGPGEIGAVLFLSCTSSRLIPSTAAWISGQLGILQTHSSADIVSACAGFPYGVAEAVRLLQEVERPVLIVLAEKFSDKIGSARPSRMIFGDGAAALILAPTDGVRDIDVVQTYASGPFSQVNSIIWPNPDFDNDITVYGPEVKALVSRYLSQMMDELHDLPSVTGSGSLIDDIDVVVPHQANKTMIIEVAEKQGLRAEDIYFNISEVGNASAASIPMAVADAVRDGAITRRSRVFAPGFGAGAVGGYVVMSIDPAIVVPESSHDLTMAPSSNAQHSSLDDVGAAFGG